MHFTQGAKEPTVGATLKFTYYNPPCLINSIDTFKFIRVLLTVFNKGFFLFLFFLCLNWNSFISLFTSEQHATFD